MKLRANVITKGRYYKAGKDIPDDLLSDAMRKYAVSEDGDGVDASYSEKIQRQRSDADWKPQAKLSSRNYVKRNASFKRADSVETIPGESLYKKDVGALSPRYVRYGRVGSE